MIKLSRIVCPTDFSPTSSRAVDYAATLAESFGAELVLLHVIPEMSYPLRSFGMSHSFQHIQEELHTRATESLDKRIAELQEKLPKLKARTVLRDRSTSIFSDARSSDFKAGATPLSSLRP